MVILKISNKQEFDEVSGGNNLLVVYFYSTWGEQCKAMNEVLEELLKQSTLKEVIFAKIIAEDLPDVSSKYQINAVPTFVLLRNGNMLDRIEGASASELTAKVTMHACVDGRLKLLINAGDVMLFMKGSPEEPRCGFSKQIVQILNETGVAYKTFDILEDAEVRNGLKVFSNWPTYPQLYVKGNLTGGVDIVKELKESQMLIKTLKNRK